MGTRSAALVADPNTGDDSRFKPCVYPLCGASDEWHQCYVPERMAEVCNVVADTLGGTGFVMSRRMRDIRRTQV